MQPEEMMMQQQSFKPKKERNHFGLVIAMGIMLFVAAIAGVIFGVYEMMMRNSEVEQAKSECQAQIAELEGKKESCTDSGTKTETAKVMTNETAHTLIHPYIRVFNYLSGVFESGLTEDAKVEIVFRNLDYSRIVKSDNNLKVGYPDLNSEYKRLFGSSKDLEKKNYSVGHSDSFAFDESSNSFNVSEYAGGGTGLGMFTVVKTAKYTSDGAIIEVYHDVVELCYVDSTSDEYCIDKANGAIIESIDEFNTKTLIEKHEKDIPVYQMTFLNDNGRLVLGSINKVN